MSETQTYTRLSGHVSAETAFIVDDYPYGFRLRCHIRYWIEYKPSHGFRFVSQTSNPKKAGIVWNKPKAGTYSKFGAVLMQGDTDGYITYTCLGIYTDAKEARTWFDKNGAFLVEEGRVDVEKWVIAKERYESLRAEGKDMNTAAVVATAERNDLGFQGINDEGKLVFKKIPEFVTPERHGNWPEKGSCLQLGHDDLLDKKAKNDCKAEEHDDTNAECICSRILQGGV